MASPTRWMWVWVNSGSWWWTGRPGVLPFMGSRRVGHDWATEVNWTESMTNLDSVLKRRAITLLTKVCIVKSMFFPIVMYRCESWTTKKAERQRIDAFEMCGSGFKDSLTVRSNQPILKEINPEYSLERLMLKLKLQQEFDHLMWRAESLEKTDAGKDWRQEEKGLTEDEMVGSHHWLNGHEFE